MKRRSALKMISVGMGYTLSAASLATLAASCKTEPKITWTPSFFSPVQAGVIEDLLEILLPATSTPGAKDVGLTQLIDLIVSDVYKEKDQVKFKAGMNAFFQQLGEEKDWAKADTPKLTGLLEDHITKLTPEDRKKIAGLLAVKQAPADPQAKDLYHRHHFMGTLRSLALSGYFSSEEVATKHLNYMPVPGPYQGCIPLEDVGSSWAL